MKGKYYDPVDEKLTGGYVRSFEDFAEGIGHWRGLEASQYVTYPGFRPIYVRDNTRWTGRGEICLAVINAVKPGEGALTRLLDQYEPNFSIFVEQILNYRLELYLQRRGYEYYEQEMSCDMLRVKR